MMGYLISLVGKAKVHEGNYCSLVENEISLMKNSFLLRKWLWWLIS